MHKDEIVTKSFHTENDEIVLRLIATSDNKDWRTQFERTILDTISKNLHQLTFEISKLEAILVNRLNEDIDSDIFENARKQSLDSCRKIMGNLEILPNPSDARARVFKMSRALEVNFTLDGKPCAHAAISPVIARALISSLTREL